MIKVRVYREKRNMFDLVDQEVPEVHCICQEYPGYTKPGTCLKCTRVSILPHRSRGFTTKVKLMQPCR